MAFAYEVLDETAVAGNQPSVTVDRLRLAMKKVHGIHVLGLGAVSLHLVNHYRDSHLHCIEEMKRCRYA